RPVGYPTSTVRPRKLFQERAMQVLAVLLCLSFPPSAAFYLHAGEREQKCLIEDVPGDTWVSGRWLTRLSSRLLLGSECNAEWLPPHHLMIILNSTFHFTSYSPGEHIICLESNSTRFVSRIHLDIRVGEHDLHAAIAQAKDKVNEVTFKLEHLMEQIEQILKEQDYQRDREEIFRMTSEDTNSNVLWWAFTQTLIFISVGVFQMKYLKDFFIAKKLV
uniref:GOLD domain-containing protein n=1 Tax=Spermophilus dauricus TaxID=99837 RepID=A0A8C9QBS5_SPEDA